MSVNMIIAIDFDGTCVTHEYPEIGRDIEAVPVIQDLIDEGHKIILWTMRSGQCLGKAVDWFRENDLELFGVNSNPFQSIWTSSPKAYAQLYIDDAAFGVPLLKTDLSERPYVDWDKVSDGLVMAGIL